MVQAKKDIASIPDFKPDPKGMRFDTGYTFSSTPGANGEFTIQNPLAAPEAKPVNASKPTMPAGKAHAALTPAQKAQADKERLEAQRKQWGEGKIAQFAQRYWTAKYSGLAHSIERIGSFADLGKVISDYENPAIKPFNIKLGSKAADDFYAKYAGKVEAAIQAHPEIKDKNAFRSLIYATFTQESSFRPHTVTLLPHVQDKFAQRVERLFTKEAEFKKAQADLKTFTPEKRAEIDADYTRRADAFQTKYKLKTPLTSQQIVTRYDSVKQALDAFKPYTVSQADRSFLGNIERQRAAGAKISAADAKKAAIIQQRIAKAGSSEERRRSLTDQFSAISALKKLSEEKKRAESAVQREKDNTLTPEQQYESGVLGKIYKEAKARVNGKVSFARALTDVLQEKLPEMYQRADANGQLKLHIIGKTAEDHLASFNQITDLTPEQQAALKKSVMHIQNSEGLLQANRQYLQYQIANLKNKLKKTDDDYKNLAALQEREDINIINEACPAAKGVGQLMDVECYNHRDTSLKTIKLIQPFDAGQNLVGGIDQLADLTLRAQGKGLQGQDFMIYPPCGYNGGPRRADNFCKDHDLSALPQETQIHIRQVLKYANTYSAIFSDAQRRRTDYVDKLIKAKNDVEDNAKDMFYGNPEKKTSNGGPVVGYIKYGQELDTTHKPAPIEKDLRADTWAYWKNRIFGQ